MRHAYVHVPFCVRRCSYCDFSIAVRKTIPARRYVDAVAAEFALRQAKGEWDDDPAETIYLGGGTPSLLPADATASLVGMLIEASRPASGDAEITIECNPDDVTPQAAAGWKAAGVNRVSLGAQSFSPGVLQWMHRTHGPEAVPRALEILRGAGLHNISLDLIFGLPEELGGVFEHDLERALALEPAHLSVYGLSVEPRTPLARWISRGSTTPPVEDRYAREFLLADRLLTAAGFEHYEVSNYARPARESRHNRAYWSERAYAGLGPAAHSFSGAERRWNLEAWSAYERALDANRDPTGGRERLSEESRRTEWLYLGLRTSAGIPRDRWCPPATAVERAWFAAGWVRDAGQAIRLTPEGWLRLDEIVAVLTTSAGGG